jgi:hypothetical protein
MIQITGTESIPWTGKLIRLSTTCHPGSRIASGNYDHAWRDIVPDWRNCFDGGVCCRPCPTSRLQDFDRSWHLRGIPDTENPCKYASARLPDSSRRRQAESPTAVKQPRLSAYRRKSARGQSTLDLQRSENHGCRSSIVIDASAEASIVDFVLHRTSFFSDH